MNIIIRKEDILENDIFDSPKNCPLARAVRNESGAEHVSVYIETAWINGNRCVIRPAFTQEEFNKLKCGEIEKFECEVVHTNI